MNESFRLYVDGVPVEAQPGQTILQACEAAGIWVPRLCWMKELVPFGSCRVCTVLANGRPCSACTQPAEPEAVVENDTPGLREWRRALVELLFVEGNHFCMFCEKSGNCELQALAYRYQMMVPRFQYEFPIRGVDASADHIFHDRNRCILCKRCIRTITKDGKHVFAFNGRGGEHLHVVMDDELASQLSEAEAQEAMEICPVGAILKKEQGYVVPIGERKYDKVPIGSDIENK